MRVLVTGGAGYIGSHVVRALERAGHPVAVYDSLIRGHQTAVTGVELHQGDLGDRERLARTLTRFRPEAVIHLAGLSLVGESVTKPEIYRRCNVEGSRTLIAELTRHGVSRLVFSSSAAVYGVPDAVPITEDAPVRPVNPYGETKAEVEQLLRDAAEAGELGAVCLRYFNAAGADQDGDLGEDHEPETHLLPLAFRAATGRSPEIVIHGNDYSTPDGTCVRDYVHASDLAEAHVAALASMAKPFRVYNLGAGRGYSVLEVIEMVERVVGRPLPRRVGPRRAGDPPVLVASIEKIQRELGWTPWRSDLKTIARTAWTWHEAHPFGYRQAAAAGRD